MMEYPGPSQVNFAQHSAPFSGYRQIKVEYRIYSRTGYAPTVITMSK